MKLSQGTQKTSNYSGIFMDFLQQIQLNIGQKVCKHKKKWTNNTQYTHFVHGGAESGKQKLCCDTL